VSVLTQTQFAERASRHRAELHVHCSARTAELLEVGVAAINSARQRAWATLREQHPVEDREGWSSHDVTAIERTVLDDYMAAHVGGDPQATLALIRDDIRVTMPPAPYLFEGREAILELVKRSGASGDWRLVPARANRHPAAACYLRSPAETTFRALKIDVLRVVDGRAAEVTTFGSKHFPAFDLPPMLS